MKHGRILIETRDICLRLNGQIILDQVSIKVHQGEIVTLIGPNGAGKSTLIKAILGLRKTDKGKVILNPDLRIGYMPQRIRINPLLPLNVKRFLTLSRRPAKAALEQALSETGAGHLMDSPMETLSGGETQRVLLARAILSNPDILILDEPVQGVDISGQEALYGLISEIRNRHDCGILMISHDLHLVMSATDRVICLNHHVCCAGHPEKIRQDPIYVALFGRNAAMMPYNHHHDHDHDAHGNIVQQDAEKPAHE